MTSLGRRFSALVLVLLLPCCCCRVPMRRRVLTRQSCRRNWPPRATCAPCCPARMCFRAPGHFSERKGQPPYVEAYDQASEPKQAAGLRDALDRHHRHACLLGQAGGHADRHGHARPLRGREGAQAFRAHLLLGIPESALLNFNNQYLGKSVADKIEVGQSRPDEERDRAGRHLRRHRHRDRAEPGHDAFGLGRGAAVGIIAPTVREPARFADHRQAPTTGRSWCKWARCSACVVQARTGGAGQGPRAFHRTVVWRPEPPRPGRSLLGDNGSTTCARAQGRRAAPSSSSARGAESFKGSGFVRGGIYDRVQVKQGADSFTFRDLDSSTSTVWRPQVRRATPSRPSS
jgi:NosR/NirI family nitrous oxide reductase transcriptional regulator